MTLPSAFIQYTRDLMGESLWQTLERGLSEEQPVSIRLNRRKCPAAAWALAVGNEPVPWCADGYYLDARPAFTFDPLLHAGVYYVQEASSMYLDHVLRQLVREPVRMLDLCAAPGGKSVCALSALPAGSVLYSNEPHPKRAQVLSENLQKWQSGSVAEPPVMSIVTNSYARDYRRARLLFDVVLADVPCSGEGMFRKDEGAIREWSLQHVEQCRLLQRDIVADIWECLRPGGLLVYSTCTMNARENEENVAWIAAELGADFVELPVPSEWGITGSLTDHHPVCRFLPGKSRGEGLFMAVLRKQGESPSALASGARNAEKKLNIVPPDFLRQLADAADAPRVELSYEQAVGYLRREAVVLPPDTPRGIVGVTFQGLLLGLAKNIGSRANNLYPKEWRIRSTHIPEYQAIIQRI